MGIEMHEFNPGTRAEEEETKLWTLNKVALIRGMCQTPCWRCGAPVTQSGLFLELGGRNNYHCRIVAWSILDDIGLLSQPFKYVLSSYWVVRNRYSKTMHCEYLAVVCPNCGEIQGNNFVYGNYKGRGGVFSNPADKTPLIAFPLPSFTDNQPQRFDWAFGTFTLEADPRRISFRGEPVIPGNAWPWRSRSYPYQQW